MSRVRRNRRYKHRPAKSCPKCEAPTRWVVPYDGNPQRVDRDPVDDGQWARIPGTVPARYTDEPNYIDGPTERYRKHRCSVAR